MLCRVRPPRTFSTRAPPPQTGHSLLNLRTAATWVQMLEQLCRGHERARDTRHRLFLPYRVDVADGVEAKRTIVLQDVLHHSCEERTP